MNNIFLLLRLLSVRQNGRQFVDDISKCIFFTENFSLFYPNPLQSVPKEGLNWQLISMGSELACRRTGYKLLSQPMMA